MHIFPFIGHEQDACVILIGIRLCKINVLHAAGEYTCMYVNCIYGPVPVAERSKARVYGRSLAGIAGSNPAGGMDGCPL